MKDCKEKDTLSKQPITKYQTKMLSLPDDSFHTHS